MTALTDIWAGTAYGLAELGSLKGDGVGDAQLSPQGGRQRQTDASSKAADSKHSGMLIEELINAVVRAEESVLACTGL